MPVVQIRALEKVEKPIRLIEPNHTSSVMLCYHNLVCLLNYLRNLNDVCFSELSESNVVRKTFTMITEMPPRGRTQIF